MLYLWNILLLRDTDKVLKHGHHGRGGYHMTVHQVTQEAHLKHKTCGTKLFTLGGEAGSENLAEAERGDRFQGHRLPLGNMLKNKNLRDVYSCITYQVNSFIVQVGF